MFSFWYFSVAAGVGAFWGLIFAFVLRWARKQRELPKWPIVTGLLLGLLAAVLNWR